MDTDQPDIVTRRPAAATVVAFLILIAAGTVLLLHPAASVDTASWSDALFTATSAVTVTGLTTVDTGTAWTVYGQTVIGLLIQLGGLGIMTITTGVALLMFRSTRLSTRLRAQAELGPLTLGTITDIVRHILKYTLVIELAAALLLTVRLATHHGFDLATAAGHGLFTSISAFNNAGFALHANSLAGYGTDPVLLTVISLTIITGGIGFPVLVELRRHLRQPRAWSIHTKVVLSATLLLVPVATALFWLFEHAHLADLPLSQQAGVAFLHGVTPRTAGFHVIDYQTVSPPTLLLTSILMFLGAAPASTGGGIKVTTFLLLASLVYAELRGDRDTTMFGRRIPGQAQRRAVAATLLVVTGVLLMIATLAVLHPAPLSSLMFETVSAVSTVGLSVGVTNAASGPTQFVLGLAMFAGRIGPLTLLMTLSQRRDARRFRYPADEPMLG